MMPNKRNPDLAELTRGRAAPAIGELVGLLALLKGLPLAYDRDLQEDKQLVFASCDRIELCLRAARHLVEQLTFDADRMAEAAAGAGAVWATDLAEALVGRGVPFREAHAAVGSLVASLEARGLTLGDASEGDLRAHHPALRASDRELAESQRALRARSGPGGTAPERVAEQATRIREIAGHLRAGGE
jgi:argininosuccinate lyase